MIEFPVQTVVFEVSDKDDASRLCKIFAMNGYMAKAKRDEDSVIGNWLVFVEIRSVKLLELERRITEAKALLEVEMGEWGATENFYLPDHFLQLRHALDVLDGGGE